MNATDIRNAQPGDTLRDDKVKGLMLRCFPNRKSWYLNFRTKSGIERKPKLADLSVMSLDQARKAASAMLIAVGAGEDPMQVRQESRGAPIVSELWGRYVEEHKTPWKSRKDQERIWKMNIAPKIGTKRVADLTYDDCYAVHRAMKKAPYQANRTLALLSAVLKKAEKFAWRPDGSNPCRHVERFGEHKRRRYMTPAEAQTIARLMREAEADNRQSIAFLYLLIYSGARCGDIRDATWPMLDGDKLRLPDSKGGAKTVHLPAAAVAVLAKLPRTATGTLTGIASPKKLWVRIRTEAGCPDLRMHDLRHSFASVAIDAGLTLAQIGELLGHKSTQTTMRYAHLMEDSATTLTRATADLITTRMAAPQSATSDDPLPVPVA